MLGKDVNNLLITVGKSDNNHNRPKVYKIEKLIGLYSMS